MILVGFGALLVARFLKICRVAVVFGIGRAFRYLSLACCWQEILHRLDLIVLNRVNRKIVQTREVWALNLLVWVLVAPGSSSWLTLSLVGAQTSFFLCAAMIWALWVKITLPNCLIVMLVLVCELVWLINFYCGTHQRHNSLYVYFIVRVLTPLTSLNRCSKVVVSPA